MLRAVLLGLLSLSAVNCKSHDATVAATASGPAGTVVQVAGTVTLHHGDATKPLGKGETVEADDVIETGADGSVVIELAHNHVSWELGANKKSKVRESLAWTQPKKDTSAKTVEEDTAAAGRHAERSAADTDVSGGAKDVTVAPAPAAAPEAEREDSPAPPPQKPLPPTSRSAAIVAAPQAAAAPSPKSDSKADEKRSPPPPPPPKTIAKAKAEPPPDLQPSSTEAIMAPGGGDSGLVGTGQGGGGGKTGGAGLGSIGSVGKGAGPSADAGSAVQAVAKTKRSELEACLGTSGVTVRVIIHVDANGKATVTFNAAATAPVKTCMKKVIDQLAFAPAQASASLLIKKP